MANVGKWIIPEYVGLGKFYIVKTSSRKRYRIWNNPNSAGDLRVESHDGEEKTIAPVKPGSSIDIEGMTIMIRRYSSSTAGNELSGEYEKID
jgi:hypothetical protein